jgi:hypothetical protein
MTPTEAWDLLPTPDILCSSPTARYDLVQPHEQQSISHSKQCKRSHGLARHDPVLASVFQLEFKRTKTVAGFSQE